MATKKQEANQANLATRKKGSGITLLGKQTPIDPNGVCIKLEPLNIRNDCSAVGQWKIGGEQMLGSALDMSILGVKRYYGKLGLTTGKWLQLFFVAAPSDTSACPKGIVCVTYIKTQSLSNWSTQAILAENPGEDIWQSHFVKQNGISKNGDKTTYHSLVWSCRPRTEAEQEQLKNLEAFKETFGEMLIDNNLPTTMFGYWDEESEAIAEAAMAALLEEAKGSGGE